MRSMTRDFGIFFVIGLLWTLVSIVIMWVLIDRVGWPGWLGSALAVVLVVLGRFYTYVIVGLMHNRLGRYLVANSGFSVLLIGMMTVSVDVLAIPARIASPANTLIVFVLKFVIFRRIDLLRRG